MVDLPSHARVVVIGGGIVGASVAYHLALRGCTDVLVLERDKLTSGTTCEMAAERMPVLAESGIRLFFNGPESFTPDDRYLLGESPQVPGLFVAAGFNSIGIQSSGGAGKVLADWISTAVRRWTSGTSTYVG